MTATGNHLLLQQFVENFLVERFSSPRGNSYRDRQFAADQPHRVHVGKLVRILLAFVGGFLHQIANREMRQQQPPEFLAHPRTTNPIESTFATVRLRQRRTKGCGSRQASLTMVFMLARQAQARWHRLNGSELIVHVLEGKKFKDGELIEQRAACPAPSTTFANNSESAVR